MIALIHFFIQHNFVVGKGGTILTSPDADTDDPSCFSGWLKAFSEGEVTKSGILAMSDTLYTIKNASDFPPDLSRLMDWRTDAARLRFLIEVQCLGRTA